MMAQVLDSRTRPATARRSAFEVRMDILKEAAAGSARPTHIMYRANTSWMILQKNLEALRASGFIRQDREGPRAEYSITERGMGVLHDYVDLVSRTAGGPREARE